MKFEPDPEDLELIQEFLEEAREQCHRAEAILLGLENGAISRSELDELFRFAHTVKGSGMAVGIPLLPDFVHHWEDCLSAQRELPDPVVLPAHFVSLYLECNDAVRGFVAEFPNGEFDWAGQFARLKRRLQDSDREAANDPGPRPIQKSIEIPPLQAKSETTLPTVHAAEPKHGVDATGDSESIPGSSGDQVEEKGEAGESGSISNTTSDASAKPKKNVAVDESVRVKLSRIDALIRKIGELSVQQEILGGKAAEAMEQSAEVEAASRKLSQLCAEAHDVALSLRMVPIRPTVQTLRRTCRDTAIKLKKSIEFVAEGESAELDLSLVQVLGEALVHMVRNAVDHGIESPETRRAAGKPELATVRLSVEQQGGSIVIEVADDGKGLDPERIRKKAIDRGWLDPDAKVSTNELFEFVFRPGFSTNDSVTEFSGRGVGLDVVSSNIRAIDGHVQLRSELGKGTSFQISMPLSVAVVDVMRVLLQGEPFLVPLHNIRETVAVAGSSIQTAYAGSQVINLRGMAVPVHDLRSTLHRERRPISLARDERRTALVTQWQGRVLAFLVDDIAGRQQVVVKPLGHELAHLKGVSGSAVLGDGSVGLIVDFQNLIGARGLCSE